MYSATAAAEASRAGERHVRRDQGARGEPDPAELFLLRLSESASLGATRAKTDRGRSR